MNAWSPPPHDGTSQAGRRLAALDPGHAVLDAGTAADALALARALAAGLPFVEADGSVRGDWQPMFPPRALLPALAGLLALPEADLADQPARLRQWAGRPQLALLLALIDLLGVARDALNQLPQRHLDHLLRAVLRMAPQPAQADAVHVLVQAEPRVPRLLLPAGTALQGGKDAQGRERVYATVHDLVASPARVVALASVRAHVQVTTLADAQRRPLQDGTREEAFLAMLRIAIGNPGPGDALPAQLAPGLPATATAGGIDMAALQAAHALLRFVGTGLGLPGFDALRRLTRLLRLRRAQDTADWALIRGLLVQAGRRRDAGYRPPDLPDDDFHGHLRAALGLDAPAYARLYDQLPEVASIEDAFARLSDRPEVQQFVVQTLRLSLPEFRSLMQTKLRIDGQWREIVQTLEDAGRRLRPGLQLGPEQRALRTPEALLAATHGALAWPAPAASLITLHSSLVAIEETLGLPAEAIDFVLGVVQRSLALPPNLPISAPADVADWARVRALLAQAHRAVVVQRRRQALLRAAQPGRRAGEPLAAVEAMLAQVLGAPVPAALAWARLADAGADAQDIAALRALAETGQAPANPSNPSTAPDPDDDPWQAAADWLEPLQRQRQGLVLGDPVQRLWHHAYAAADARSVPAPAPEGQAAWSDGHPRWLPFGSTAAATAPQPAPPLLGLALSSGLLALAEGERQIVLMLGLDADPAVYDAALLATLFAAPPEGSAEAQRSPFEVTVSGPEGWITPARVACVPNQAYPTVSGVDTRGLRSLSLTLQLAAQQPALVPATVALHGLQADVPVLRLMLKAPFDARHGCHHSDAQALAGLRLARLALQVRVRGLSQLALQNDQAVVDPRQPFEPFGSQPSSGARLSIAHPELVSKALDSIGFRCQWMGAPASLKAHYAGYPGNLESASFTVGIGLRDGTLFSAAPALLPLFGGADAPGSAQLVPGPVPDPGRLAEPDSLPAPGQPPAQWRRCWVWELAGDLRHGVYPALALQRAVELATATTAALAPGSQAPKPQAAQYTVQAPYTPKLKSLLVDYSASAEQAAVPDEVLRQPGRQPLALLHHLMPFSQAALRVGEPDPASTAADVPALAAGATVPLLPPLPPEGELLIGLAGLQPGAAESQRLSLLLQVAEGSADPEARPAPVAWAVRDGSRWRSLQEGALRGGLRSDGTRGLIQSGIVELTLPPLAPARGMVGAVALVGLDGKPLPAAGAGAPVWLRLQRQREVAGVCDMVAVHPNAVLARRLAPELASDDLARPLPPGQVQAPVQPLAGLAAVQQPYSSFGGRPAEADAAFRIRAAERLRHRQRALTPWDYEHLVLARFPQLYKAKCLRAGSLPGAVPGQIDLLVVPDLVHRRPADPFAPRCSAELIAEIHDFLADKLPTAATLVVRNAHFIAVKVRCGVRFVAGSDEGFSRQRLNDDLNRHLSPWAFDEGAELVIGGSLYANSILHFIETRPYVDYVAGLRLFTGEDGRFSRVPDGPGQRITPSRPDAVLVAAATHEFDVIPEGELRVRALDGIGSLRIELDFIVG